MYKTYATTQVHVLPQKAILINMVWDLMNRVAEASGISFDEAVARAEKDGKLDANQAKSLVRFQATHPGWVRQNDEVMLRRQNVVYSLESIVPSLEIPRRSETEAIQDFYNQMV
jgi:hypothetical protein